MSISITAVVGTPDAAFVQTQLAALRQAYVMKDVVGTFALAEELLQHLGEYPDETDRQVAGAARLFRGWAYLTTALRQRGKDAAYPSTLQHARDDLDRALTAFLANDETFVERVTAEGYLAYAKCLLGMNEEADVHLAYLDCAVSDGGNLGAMSVYLQMVIAIKKLRGEITEEPAATAPAAQVVPAETAKEPEVQLYALPPLVKGTLRKLMEDDQPEQVLELTGRLMKYNPQKMQAVTALTIRQARVWALMAAARRTADRQRRTNCFHEAMPLLRHLISYSSSLNSKGAATLYVTNMLNLVYALYSLGGGHDNEAQQCMATVMKFVAERGDRRLRLELEAARVQIDGVVLMRSCVPA